MIASRPANHCPRPWPENSSPLRGMAWHGLAGTHSLIQGFAPPSSTSASTSTSSVVQARSSDHGDRKWQISPPSESTRRILRVDHGISLSYQSQDARTMRQMAHVAVAPKDWGFPRVDVFTACDGSRCACGRDRARMCSVVRGGVFVPTLCMCACVSACACARVRVCVCVWV
jgi:hypothetical protein